MLEWSRGVAQPVVYPHQEGFCGCRSRWLCLGDTLNTHGEARRKKGKEKSLSQLFHEMRGSPEMCATASSNGSFRNKTERGPEDKL